MTVATTLMRRRAARRQAGVSILELMIAITIGLFLLAGLVSVFATSNQAYVELGRASQQIENGRLAMQYLIDDIGAAGFYGRFSGSLPVG
jgi:type IV pilus assembly protein PilW